MFEYITDASVEVLEKSVYTILEKQGVYCESESMLKAYENFGAKVDYDDFTVTFAPSTVRAFIDDIKSEDKSKWDEWMKDTDRNKQLMYSGYVPYNKENSIKKPEDPYFFHCTGTYFYDDETDKKRAGNREDFIEVVKFANTFHPKKGVGQVLLLPNEEFDKIEPLTCAMLLLEYADNPTGVYVQNIEQIKYIEKIMDIAGIDNPYFPWFANASFNSPLKIDRVLGERYAYMIKSGLYPAKVYAMPVNGVNIPITVGGAIAVMAAEFIALWIAARSMVTDKMPLVGMPLSGTMDMANGNVSFTAMDSVITRLSVCEFIKKLTGIVLTPGPGEYTPTKVPSLFNTLEKAYFANLSANSTGYYPGIGIGHIDAGLTISLVQFLYDYDYTQSISFLEKSDITKENIGIDTILKMGFAKKDSFLMEDHTLSNIRKSSWMPEFFTRSGWSEQEEGKSKRKAIKKIKDIKSKYKKPKGREEILHKCKNVIEKAKMEL